MEPHPTAAERRLATAQRWVNQASAHITAKRFAEALHCVRMALLYDPQNSELWEICADLSPSPDERTAALAKIEQLRNPTPVPPAAHVTSQPLAPVSKLPGPPAPRTYKNRTAVMLSIAVGMVLIPVWTFGAIHDRTTLPVPTETTFPTLPPYVTATPYYSSSSTLSGGSSGSSGSTCADGTHSSSHGRGTCSHHGGIK